MLNPCGDRLHTRHDLYWTALLCESLVAELPSPVTARRPNTAVHLEEKTVLFTQRDRLHSGHDLHRNRSVLTGTISQISKMICTYSPSATVSFKEHAMRSRSGCDGFHARHHLNRGRDKITLIA